MQAVQKDENEEWVDPTELDFYKEMKAEETPGKNLRFYRKLVGLTQKELAEKIGVSKQYVSDMEGDRRSISKKMAKELASLFHISPVRFL